MSEYLRLLVELLVAVNPAAVVLAISPEGVPSNARVSSNTAAVGLAIAVAIYAIVAATAQPVIDWLQIEPETFRIAAGIVVAVGGVFVLWRGRWGDAPPEPGWETAIFPLALPLFACPWGLASTLSYSVDHGIGMAIGAATPVLVVTAVVVAAYRGKAVFALDAVARITGGLAVAVAAGLIVSGVRAI